MTPQEQSDLIEELNFLRSGKPYHTHRWSSAEGEQKVRCSSPYCSTLGEPRQEEVSRA